MAITESRKVACIACAVLYPDAPPTTFAWLAKDGLLHEATRSRVTMVGRKNNPPRERYFAGYERQPMAATPNETVMLACRRDRRHKAGPISARRVTELFDDGRSVVNGVLLLPVPPPGVEPPSQITLYRRRNYGRRR